MERLSTTSDKVFQRNSSEEDHRWRNVNISMKTPLLERLDDVVDSELVPSDSRSMFVREILREKLSELESETGETL
jgi:metal-responsive CopG/Arc/MetJ family transcriptional regulator